MTRIKLLKNELKVLAKVLDANDGIIDSVIETVHNESHAIVEDLYELNVLSEPICYKFSNGEITLFELVDELS